MASSDRVMALSMRPKLLEDLVGQEENVNTLSAQFATGRIPHFYIIHGPVGAGKTTLARIISLVLQTPNPQDFKLTEEDWQNYKKYDIHEINAANKNGIDDVRSLVEIMKYQPLPPSKSKVVILDEAHQLTNPAQNALITETEDVSKHVYYIFCTSAVNKIIPALQRRAYLLTPKSLDDEAIIELINKAKEKFNFEGEIDQLIEALQLYSVRSPGLILQAAEKYFIGISAMEAVFSSESCKLDTMAICRAIVNGCWKDATNQLKNATKSDTLMIKACILGYLKSIIVKSIGTKAISVAKAIKSITETSNEDSEALPSLLAGICFACEHLKK